MSKSKAIGTRAETAVVKAARARGFAGADRHVMKGALDEGDVWLCPGVIIECKGGEMARSASDNLIDQWMGEVERETANAGAEIGFLVVQRRAVGEANAHRWWAIMTSSTFATLIMGEPAELHGLVRMTLEDALIILRAAGWGDELEDQS